MSDLISRQAAIDAARDWYEGLICGSFKGLEKRLRALPPAEPKRGEWIRTGSGSLFDHYECSLCGGLPKWECMGNNRWKIAFTDFCPNCGCRMDGGEQ